MKKIKFFFIFILLSCNSITDRVSIYNLDSQIEKVIVKYYIIVSASEEPVVCRDTILDLSQNMKLYEVLNKGIKVPQDEKSFKFKAAVTYDFYFQDNSSEEYHVLYKTENGTIVEKYSVGPIFKRSLGGFRNHDIETFLDDKIPLIFNRSRN